MYLKIMKQSVKKFFFLPNYTECNITTYRYGYIIKMQLFYSWTVCLIKPIIKPKYL